MKLLQVELTNYRCFGPGTTTWTPGGSSQLLIGPSNGGKSTLGRAVESALSLRARAWDIHVAAAGQEMTIACEFGLSVEESVELAQELFGERAPEIPRLPDSAWEGLSISLFERIRVTATHWIDSGGEFRNRQKLTTPVVSLNSDPPHLDVLGNKIAGPINWVDLLDRWSERDVDTPLAPGEMTDWLTNHNAGAIVTSVPAAPTGLAKLNDGVRVLQEVRPRPSQTANDTTETWTGDALPGVLGALFGGSQSERARYSLIKETFEALHPGLGLHPQRINNQWELRFNMPGLQDPVPGMSVGMGTVQSLLLITNLLSSERRVIVLEEPELHLHPPALVALRPLIRRVAEANQVILLTHSPLLVDTAAGIPVMRLEPHKRVDRVEGKDISDLGRLHPVWAREALVQACFARSVLIVEGPYDQLMFSNLFATLDSDWLGNEIAVVAVDGKRSVLRAYDFLRTMDIKPVVCMDDDALTAADSSHEGVTMSVALAQAAGAGILGPEERQELMDYHRQADQTSPYPAEFVEAWRAKLRDRSWYVLSDSLDRLVLIASGATPSDSKGGKTQRNREAEEASRSLPRESVPAEVVAIFDELKSR